MEAKCGSTVTMERIFPSLTEVNHHNPVLHLRNTNLPFKGVAYDTEKEFDTMFAKEPYINKQQTEWA